MPIINSTTKLCQTLENETNDTGEKNNQVKFLQELKNGHIFKSPSGSA